MNSITLKFYHHVSLSVPLEQHGVVYPLKGVSKNNPIYQVHALADGQYYTSGKTFFRANIGALNSYLG